MRGPDRKGVRGLTNMTDSHMVGGHRPTSNEASVLKQILGFLTVLALAAGILVTTALLGSEEPALKRVGWGIVGLLVVVALVAYFLRRKHRGSIDEALRSTRHSSRPHP